MVTISTFFKVWNHYMNNFVLQGYVSHGGKLQIDSLFQIFMEVFGRQFNCPEGQLWLLPQDQEITGEALEAFRVWVEHIDQVVQTDYASQCGFAERKNHLITS